MHPKTENGIAYLARSSLTYQEIKNDRWELQPFESPRDEEFQGVRMIDGKLTNVWYSTSMKMFIAQSR